MRKYWFILLILIPWLGCSLNNAPKISTPTTAQIAEFAAHAKITLPPSARPLGWCEERGMDDALWLQASLPATDLPAFLDNSPFRGMRLATNNPYLIYCFRDFLPTPPLRYRSGECQLPNARCLKMMVDESNHTNSIVYMMWHET